jgi:hypothetical protein
MPLSCFSQNSSTYQLHLQFQRCPNEIVKCAEERLSSLNYSFL